MGFWSEVRQAVKDGAIGTAIGAVDGYPLHGLETNQLCLHSRDGIDSYIHHQLELASRAAKSKCRTGDSFAYSFTELPECPQCRGTIKRTLPYQAHKYGLKLDDWSGGDAVFVRTS